MSSKLTEITESSPSSPPPSVLCGSGILSQLASPWSMASSGHFDPAQTYDGYKRNSDELDGEEVEVVHNSVGHQYSTSSSHPPTKRFQSHIIASTPRTFQPTLATIPTSLPPSSQSSSTTRPALIPAVRPSPIHQSRNSPIVTS
ncbi:hypothetical protein O181_065233 [Austropuccinia psidii MF-1]|uniref:Uncharacterized protein n=1 Tax=Austropuccinia psidii MF-1 TaxID=1389203 RepID=A0A9Q3I2E0_9BASI|nr:hypothetical protein [Austropuccinia psidii MF-1]